MVLLSLNAGAIIDIFGSVAIAPGIVIYITVLPQVLA